MSAIASQFRIQITNHEGAESHAVLHEEPIVIGSSRRVDIQIKARYVSKRHLRITREDHRVFITDLDSTNGTYLNGHKLPAGQPREWRPGDTVTIGQARLVLETIGAAGGLPPRLAAPLTEFQLAAESGSMGLTRPALLKLYYDGPHTQQVYFEGNALTGDFTFSLDPSTTYVAPGNEVEVRASASTSRTHLLGGRYTAEFSAFTADGLFDSVEVSVRLRPSYFLWLLLGLGAVLLFILLFVLDPSPEPTEVAIIPSQTPTETSTATPTITTTPTITLTATATTTETETVTATPTQTVTVTSTVTATTSVTPSPVPTVTATATAVCVNQCAFYGWPNLIVQSGDTLFSLALAYNVNPGLVAQVNCIADPNVLFAGQSVCLPCADSNGDGFCDQILTMNWTVPPPERMASMNDGCPATPVSARATVHVTSSASLAEIAGTLDIDGQPARTIPASNTGAGEYSFDFHIPDEVAHSAIVNGRLRVTARDNRGQTASVEGGFSITRCPPQPPPPPADPTITPTPVPAPLSLSWEQSPPGTMTGDNFFCPALSSSTSPVVRATGDFDLDEITASVTVDDGSGPQSFNLSISGGPDDLYSFTMNVASYNIGNGSGQIQVYGRDTEDNEATLTHNFNITTCTFSISWDPQPGSSVTANNALCPAIPESVSGVVVISVPQVIDDGNVTAQIAGSGFSQSLPVTPEGSGRYAVQFAAQGVSYTGPATIQVTAVDQRGDAHTVTSSVTIADCTLTFQWTSLPSEVIAGSNATCPTIERRTSGFISASLPGAVASTSAQITINLPQFADPFALPVLNHGSGLFEVFIDASELPPVNASNNTIRFTALDIAGGSYELTRAINIQDCRGDLTWVEAPPAQMTLGECATLPSLGITARFAAEVPALVSLSTVSAEGRNERGVVNYSSITSPATGQYEFVIDAVPEGTVIGESVTIRGFAPDHRPTAARTVQIVECPDP